MNKKDKALKRRLRGLKKLQEALDYLGWARWTPLGEEEEGEFYVVGQGSLVRYVAALIQDSIEEEKKASAPEKSVDKT